MAKQKRDRRQRIDGILYPYVDAKQDVGPLKRELIDIWKGKRGVARECMDAQCATRLWQEFPHPFFGIAVIKSRAYVFDSPNSLIRYLLASSESRRIGIHDAEGVAEPGEVMFYAPKGAERKGSDKRQRAELKGKKKRTPSNGLPLARGQKQRVLAAVGAGRAGK